MPDNQDIDAALDDVCWSLEARSTHGRQRDRLIFSAGASYGVAKREAVERAAIADLSHEGLSERIARSTVGKRLIADAKNIGATQ